MRCRRSHKLKRRTAESPQRAIANIFVVLKNLGGIRRRRRGQSPSESTNVKLCKLAERKVDIYRNYKESGINDALPSLDRMIYDNDRGLRKALIDDLATCNWMRLENGPLNILVTGMAGTGKTWLVKSLGKAALEHGYRVLYMRAPQLVEKLRLARQDNEPAKLRNRLNSKDLLIIDDFAMTPLDEATKDDLLSLIDERQGRASMMVASQRPLSQWCEYLGSGLHADAIVDRLRNTSYRIALKGRSLRENTEIAKKLKEVEEE